MTSGDDIFRNIGIPVIVSACTAAVGMFIKWIFHVFEKKSKDLDKQLERAQKLHDLIISDMDALFSRMRHQAVFIAFINAKDPDNMSEEDHAKWKAYTDILLKWKKNDVTYGSELESYFCKSQDWTEHKTCKELFDLVNEDFEAVSQRLWKLYHANSNEKFIDLEEGTFTPVYKDVQDDWMKESLQFTEFKSIETNLLTLSQQMTARIQQLNVGDLKVKKCCWAS